jgi:hypothetical protein
MLGLLAHSHFRGAHASLLLRAAVDADTPTALRSPISGTVNVATMPAVTFSPTSPITVKSLDACALYSLAFFIEQVSGTLPPVHLHADFTLAKPVVLENISMDCGGRTIHVLLQVDGDRSASMVPPEAPRPLM